MSFQIHEIGYQESQKNEIQGSEMIIGIPTSAAYP